jgi:hypothetical protein
MFTNNFKLDGIENILDDIGYLNEEAKDENDAGEKDDKKDKKDKKEGKPKRWWDDDGDGVGYEKGEVGGKFKKEEKEEKESEKEEKESGKDEGGKHKEYKHAKGKEEKGEKKTEKEVNEKIDVGADAGKTISDFVHSSAKTFSGDSKKQRIKRALGAYYGAQKEEVEIEEGKVKGADGKACWKGYKYAGTENGKDKCVPMEEYMDVYTQMIEEGYTIDQVREVLAAYEDGFEVIFEEDGVTINDTQEVLDEEAQFLSDVEMVADWLYTEGVIENEDQFFELMEDLSEEEIEELYDLVLEATAMAKRGYDETKLRSRAGGGEAADRATALEKKPTYGDANKAKQRQNYARAQRGDYRKTASSNPGLHGYAHKSNDPKVKAKQAARGAQRGALTPKEKKDLNMGYEMIGNSLEEGGLEVRNYSWKEVMEAQVARNNPEKYEAEQKKKTSKSAMPPRGDKRREDFEKWYAANVR